MNLEKSKQEFIKYTENYNLEEERIKEKQTHSLRVMEISKQIAEGIGLSKEEIEIATLIGLLHDIARFEQYTRYGTFRDLESIDHGDWGAEILQKDIRKYIDTNEFDEIIFKAVKNHNKFKIQEELTEKEKLFSKIVRDADKIDLLHQGVENYWKGKEQEVENSIISKEAVHQIRNYSQTKRKKEESEIDNVIRCIAFIFDVNFKPSFEMLKKEDYINKILNRYELKDEYTRETVQEIRIIANRYIDEKLSYEESVNRY